MPHRRVIDLPGEYHFVTFSTYLRRRYLDSPETRNIVIEALEKTLVTQSANCAGFVIMPDHVHAIIFGDENFKISPFLQVWKKTSSYRIKRFFAQELTSYSKMCRNDSPVWQTRFYDFNLEAGKLNEKLDYMHDNPVLAGLAENIVAWNWSSARFYELEEPVGVTIIQKH